jgi:peptidoglycan hydrolase-like protein with peptidoglycan-binding domain
MKQKRLLSILVGLALCVALPAAGDEAAPEPTATYSPEQLVQLWYQVGTLLRENGDYPYVELQKGDKGYEVRALQTRLAELGYYGKKVVDEFGAGTHAAMRLFEQVNRLRVDGIASVADQRLLFSNLAQAGNGAVPTPAKGAASPEPTVTLKGHYTVGLQTIDPAILGDLFATPTPKPTIYIPPIDFPDLDIAWP